MSDRKSLVYAVLVLFMIFLGLLVDASVRTDIARGDATLVCHEDEVALPVDYRTPGAVEDEVGITRMCVPVDVIEGEAYSLGRTDGYEYGYLDGWGAAVDEAERIAFDQGYDAGWRDGLAEGPVQIIHPLRIIRVPVVLPPYVEPRYGPR